MELLLLGLAPIWAGSRLRRARPPVVWHLHVDLPAGWPRRDPPSPIDDMDRDLRRGASRASAHKGEDMNEDQDDFAHRFAAVQDQLMCEGLWEYDPEDEGLGEAATRRFIELCRAAGLFAMLVRAAHARHPRARPRPRW